MTHAERAEIEQAVAALPAPPVLSWAPHADDRFTRLSAHPCPLLDGTRCTVYAVRPFNCRRWGCFRADSTTEAYEPEANMLGCANLRERLLQSSQVRREYRRLHRQAEAWGRAHGWA